jgi:hypothetical protein
METQTMLRKKSFTIVEQAIDRFGEEFDQKHSPNSYVKRTFECITALQDIVIGQTCRQMRSVRAYPHQLQLLS